MEEEHIIYRKKYHSTETLGIWVNSYGIELCRTLENAWLQNQPNISCIPEGEYNVKKFNGKKYKDVWILENVPNRSYILIHAGNLPEHTQGCILVGKRWGFLHGENVAILSSSSALENLKEILPDNFKLRIIRADYETKDIK